MELNIPQVSSKPLRVVLLTSRLSASSGGLAVSVPIMAQSIDRFDDLETHVFGTSDPRAVEAAKLWGPRVKSFDPAGLSGFQYCPSMLDSLFDLDPDIVDVQGLWTYHAAASLMFARKSRRPYVVTPRGMLDPWSIRNSKLKKLVARLVFQKAHLNGATCLRATAEMEADHFQRLDIRKPIAIVPNCIRIPALRVKRRRTLKSLLFLSRIHPKKGVSHLINAWAKLEQQFSGWELLIAGMDENGHEDELKSLSERHGLRRVRFLGPLHGESKQQTYRDADVFVLPTYAENFGLVIAEALAQELPVVTTRNAPWEGLANRQCGWWIEQNENVLTDVLRLAMSLPSEQLAEMGKRGRRWMQQDFGPQPMADKMRNLYLWVAGKGAKPDFVYV